MASFASYLNGGRRCRYLGSVLPFLGHLSGCTEVQVLTLALDNLILSRPSVWRLRAAPMLLGLIDLTRCQRSPHDHSGPLALHFNFDVLQFLFRRRFDHLPAELLNPSIL